MSDFTDRQWARAGVQARREMDAVRRPLAEAVAESVVKGLVGVRFASGRALDLAKALGLSWPAFESQSGAGKNGAFTADDVRRIHRVERGIYLRDPED